MTTAVCYVTTCKGRLSHLQQTLPCIVGQPGIACVVVDYGCPDGAADWVISNHPEVGVVRVADDSSFNASRARNLGAAAMDTPWLAFFDADVFCSPQFASIVVPQLRRGYYYRPEPVTPQTWGSIICHRADFAAIGGYDEAFMGWGGEDDDLYARLAMSGLRQATFPAALISEIAHDDALRVRFHAVKERSVQHRINMLYMQVKHDLMQLTGKGLAFDMRKSINSEVRRTIIDAIAQGQTSASLEVALPKQMIKPPPINGQIEHWQLNRKIVYSIDIAARHIERCPES